MSQSLGFQQKELVPHRQQDNSHRSWNWIKKECETTHLQHKLFSPEYGSHSGYNDTDSMVLTQAQQRKKFPKFPGS